MATNNHISRFLNSGNMGNFEDSSAILSFYGGPPSAAQMAVDSTLKRCDVNGPSINGGPTQMLLTTCNGGQVNGLNIAEPLNGGLAQMPLNTSDEDAAIIKELLGFSWDTSFPDNDRQQIITSENVYLDSSAGDGQESGFNTQVTGLPESDVNPLLDIYLGPLSPSKISVPLQEISGSLDHNKSHAIPVSEVIGVASPAGVTAPIISRSLGHNMSLVVSESEVTAVASSAGTTAPVKKKQGRKPKALAGINSPQPVLKEKKPRAYEVTEPFEDKVKEKKRQAAIYAKRHRDEEKQEKESKKRKLMEVIAEIDDLKRQVETLQKREKALLQQVDTYKEKARSLMSSFQTGE